MALALMAAVLVLGSAWFVVKSYFSGFALYMTDFFSLTFYRGDTEWLSGWSVGFVMLPSLFAAPIYVRQMAKEQNLA